MKISPTFENKAKGEKLRYDEGKPGETGHKGESHWHRPNPDTTSRHDEYLDADDNPVPEHSDPSHQVRFLESSYIP
jgi:hypothetical protein